MFKMMTQGIWKFSVFVTLTLIINFIIYHVLTNLSLTSSQDSILARNLLARPDLERLISVLAQVNNYNQTCTRQGQSHVFGILPFDFGIWTSSMDWEGSGLPTDPLTITPILQTFI